ncbi:MAG: nucleotide exchange factor GrpE [Polyangiaceae bacterium]|nr:nucleotide exchange factor GrpE [Polyangiaceae bacterium]
MSSPDPDHDPSDPPLGPEGAGAAPSSAGNGAEDPSREGEVARGRSVEDELAAAKGEVARIRDQLLRTAADFDNFRKRSRREAQDADRHGREDLLRELLPVFDNLERAAAHAEGQVDATALGDGIRMVLRQFRDTLSRLDIHRVATVGQAFDPSTMEAIQHQESTEHPPGHVAAEVQPGYRLGDRLVRPAMVVVAKAAAS